MGIESDQLVYDYLGKVGDLAQQQGLLSGDRVRLVSELRADIDRRRAAMAGGDNPAAVKKLLAKIGTPAEVVVAAGGRPPGAPAPIEPTHIEPGPSSAARQQDAGAGRPAGGGAPAGDAGADRTGIFSAADQATRAAREKLSQLTDLSAFTSNLTSGFTGRTPSQRRGDDRSARRTARPATPDVPAQPQPQSPPQPAAERPAGPRLRKEAAGEPEAGEAPEVGEGAEGFGAPGPAYFRPPGAASPPHLAGEDELGLRESNPDWWLSEPGPLEVSPFDGGVFAPQGQGPGYVDGFVGGIDLPDLLKPPGETGPGGKPVEKLSDGSVPDITSGKLVDGTAGGGGAADEGGGKRRGLLRRVLRRRGGKSGSGGGAIAWLAVVAALLLLVGGAFSSWIALGFGWVLAYNTRGLTRGETTAATIGVPSLAVFGGMVWLWGRFEGRWGVAIPEDGMGDALADTAPAVIRFAAFGSALYLVWRVQRKRNG